MSSAVFSETPKGMYLLLCSGIGISATRGLFWDRPRNFELRPDEQDNPRGKPSPPKFGPSTPNFLTILAEGCSIHDVRFNVHHAHKHSGLQ
ncbi:hypothetical protein AVEN_194250-1 [Araneus ventricosus]|uniref:Uncharacterized protein n=1 Tax=Araneus ventricosus TaxID=182803 RepID=A0A4Y2GED5_ARAVE|nr:hypothetical protein AVEN_194250-1 [Araneus ventricosus]